MNISFEHNPIILIACAALAAAYAILFYYRNQANKPFSKPLLYGLSGIRFTVVFLILVLILGPVVKRYLNRTEAPRLLMALDVSQSMVADSGGRNIRESFESLKSELESDYNVNAYYFGEETTTEPREFEDAVTDYRDLFRTLHTGHEGTNVAASVVFGDGIYTRGKAPAYVSEAKTFSLYTVGAGDTTGYGDARIEQAAFNEIAFLGNRFIVEFNVRFTKAPLQNYSVEVALGDSIVSRESLTPTNTESVFEKRVEIEAGSPGRKRLSIRVSSFENERNIANNVSLGYIDVIDNRKRILITGAAPHPDIKHLKRVLSTQLNYDVRSSVFPSLPDNLEAYDLLICVNLNEDLLTELIEPIRKAGIPCWYVLGGSTPFALYNKADIGIQIENGNNSRNALRPLLNPAFNVFTLPDNLNRDLSKYPPLSASFGNFRFKEQGQVMLYQQIGDIETTLPLWTFFNNDSYKWTVTNGEGLFRWRLTEHETQLEESVFFNLVTQTADYLILREDKSRFKVQAPTDVFENESIRMRALVYNAAFKPVTDATVSINITDEDDKVYNYTFSPNEEDYRLTAGTLPAGNYRYEAYTDREELKPITGSFLVKELNLEQQFTQANHAWMKTLSSETGGKFFYPNQLDDLKATLKARNDKPTLYSREVFDALIGTPWILFLLSGLLIIEWFVRKYNGSI